MANEARTSGGGRDGLRVLFAARGGEVLSFAAGELAQGIGRMLGEPVDVSGSYEIETPQLLILLGRAAPLAAPKLERASYSISPSPTGIALRGGSEGAVLHAVYKFFEQLGARFPLGRPATFPSLDRFHLLSAAPVDSEPAFSHRGFVSDIMTWNYTFADRLGVHLDHDREFIPWMAHHGINSFSFIRHAHDTRYRIDELAPTFRERGIAVEYGGHIAQQLLPRERFEQNPEFFPLSTDGARMAHGNLCVSNADALGLAARNAVEFAALHPENELLHVWGADVWDGAWCACSSCSGLNPQLQYMKLVNEIADGLVNSAKNQRTKVAYLAYHDTLIPDPALRPHPSVWFEWAPRERCYSHAIDDSLCRTNPRYFESLRRYVELFDGRGIVFEYYADAILFGGLGFATPSIIARDLKAYRRLGLRAISCLTFGQFSTLAYPVNLNAFVKCAWNPDSNPEAVLADTAAERHPVCAAPIAAAYRAIARASAMVLTYGDVMRPFMAGTLVGETHADLDHAINHLQEAIAAADSVASNDAMLKAERQLWAFSIETLEGLRDYLAARQATSEAAPGLGSDAIARIKNALRHVREISLEQRGTWGAYDLEWMHHLWLDGLHRHLG